MIVLVNLVLNRTVVDSDWRFDSLCGSHLQSQSELQCITLTKMALNTLIYLIGQLSCFVLSNLRSGPILAASIHSHLRGRAKKRK